MFDFTFKDVRIDFKDIWLIFVYNGSQLIKKN